MDSIHPEAIHFLVRAVLIAMGALMLWAAPVSVAGLVLMLVGVICAVSAFTLEKTEQFYVRWASCRPASTSPEFSSSSSSSSFR